VILKPYQNEAKQALVNFAKDYIVDKRDKLCVFQAPTGSGKTVIMASVIDKLIKELTEPVCYIWLSIGTGDLHLQSKRALSKFLEKPILDLEDLVKNEYTHLSDKEILVVNWEKLRAKKDGCWSNIIMRDGEQINLIEILAETRKYTKIILIIDESHQSAGSARSLSLREIILPSVTFEMSATPLKSKDIKRHETILPGEVIEAGMIKKEICVNIDLDEVVEDELSSQNMVLEASYRKRLELKALYESQGSPINPLAIIQLPNAKAGEEKLEQIKTFLAEKDITVENGKLAVWLSEEKDNLDAISELDNTVEFLIFKQAVAIGWDCPRAQILVLFREAKNESFKIQVVGRILRMPERSHYEEEKLNKGYVYTNIQNIIIAKDKQYPDLVKKTYSKLKIKPLGVKLDSYFKPRDEKLDILDDFEQVFLQEAKDLSIKDLRISDGKYKQQIASGSIAAGQIIEFEVDTNKSLERKSDKVISLETDPIKVFEQRIKSNLGGFKTSQESISCVRSAIYAWFKQNNIVISEIIASTYLDEENKILEEILSRAISKYKETHEMIKKARAKTIKDFAPQESISWSTSEIQNYTKYVYTPPRFAEQSKPERNFQDFLENLDEVVWWWKNGDRGEENLGVKYLDSNGAIRITYPDYLVKFKSGKFGLFEIKSKDEFSSGTDTVKRKAGCIQKYIKDMNKKYPEQTLFGGIVIFDGVWKLNETSPFDWSKEEDWKRLTELTGN